jgi:hypothetical protein
MPGLTAPVRIAVVASVILALAGCAHSPDGKPAVCDGRHRRPANPYGSVLPVFPGQANTPPDAQPTAHGAKPPLPPPPGPLSAIDPRSLAPCGSRA